MKGAAALCAARAFKVRALGRRAGVRELFNVSESFKRSPTSSCEC